MLLTKGSPGQKIRNKSLVFTVWCKFSRGLVIFADWLRKYIRLKLHSNDQQSSFEFFQKGNFLETIFRDRGQFYTLRSLSWTWDRCCCWAVLVLPHTLHKCEIMCFVDSVLPAPDSPLTRMHWFSLLSRSLLN